MFYLQFLKSISPYIKRKLWHITMKENFFWSFNFHKLPLYKFNTREMKTQEENRRLKINNRCFYNVVKGEFCASVKWNGNLGETVFF